MHRNGDIITEGIVVQKIDAEKQDNVHNPAVQWNRVFLYEKRRARAVKLGYISYCRDEDELDKSEEPPLSTVSEEPTPM